VTRDEASAFTGFAANPLDRRAGLRVNAEAIRSLAAGPVRVVVMCGERMVAAPGPPVEAAFDVATAARFGAGPDIFLGVGEDGTAWFGGQSQRAEDALKAEGLMVRDLRPLMVERAVDDATLAILGQARGLLVWHRTHPRCARCGEGTVIADGGWRRSCPACGASHFPRTDPVVIMLAHRGDACLLARKPVFAPGMYSCLAGFVEPGETIEDAVRRETLEEAAIRVGRVAYHAAQPWPMPFSQLMIGCFAEALNDDITLEDAELEAGRWFSRAECRAMLEGTHPEGLFCPPPAAIAHTLLRAWIEGAG
jgi:NAD+ diphosphatase